MSQRDTYPKKYEWSINKKQNKNCSTPLEIWKPKLDRDSIPPQSEKSSSRKQKSTREEERNPHTPVEGRSQHSFYGNLSCAIHRISRQENPCTSTYMAYY